jgi:hypothetical protein
MEPKTFEKYTHKSSQGLKKALQQHYTLATCLVLGHKQSIA